MMGDADVKTLQQNVHKMNERGICVVCNRLLDLCIGITHSESKAMEH
jgi:hypothetical protein